MASFNLDTFRTEVLSGFGLSRTNLFEVLIPPPRALSSSYGSISNVVSMYVEQTSLPLLNIITKSQKIFGPSYQRPLTSEYGGEGIPITFHVDRNMNIKKFFDDWMHSIIHPQRFTVGYLEDYTTTIKIVQLDEQNNSTYEVELYEAFPKNMNIMELNNASSNQTHRLTILFAYRYWQSPGSKIPVDIPRPIRFPGVPTQDARLTQNDSVPFDNRTLIGTQDENGNITNITGP